MPGVAAWGKTNGKAVALELATDEKRFGWMKDAKVAYEGTTVFLRVAVPPRLLAELPNASGADLGLPNPTARPRSQSGKVRMMLRVASTG